jgi:hypothetical protein
VSTRWVALLWCEWAIRRAATVAMEGLIASGVVWGGSQALVALTSDERRMQARLTPYAHHGIRELTLWLQNQAEA